MSSLENLVKTIGFYADFPIGLAESENRNLIYVNKHFTQTTGYSYDNFMNQNCKFLQGEDTDLEAIENIRNSLNNKRSVFQDLVNYKRSGVRFINRLVLLCFDYEQKSFVLALQMEVNEISQNKFHVSILNDKFMSPLNTLLFYAEELAMGDKSAKNKTLKVLSNISYLIKDL